MQTMYGNNEMSDLDWVDAAQCQYADAYGSRDKERAWILTPLDAWVKNPNYRGAPQPHPESYDY